MSEINSDDGDRFDESMETDCLTPCSRKDVKHAWTQDDEAVINEHVEYHSKMILDLSTKLVEGPNKSYKAPCKPNSNILNVLKGVRPNEASAKTKILTVQNMTADDFNRYLRGLIVDECDSVCDNADKELLTMSDVADRLNTLNKELNDDCNRSLRKAIELGEALNIAYNKFAAEKRESKLEGTWKTWIESFTKISERYSRQLRKMADLIGKYPKL